MYHSILKCGKKLTVKTNLSVSFVSKRYMSGVSGTESLVACLSKYPLLCSLYRFVGSCRLLQLTKSPTSSPSDQCVYNTSPQIRAV